MLKHIEATNDSSVAFTFEGVPMMAAKDDSVASALLANGQTTFRESPASGAQRGPFCMMGICFECLVEIDGVANRQACMTRVRDGMAVRRQHRVGR